MVKSRIAAQRKRSRRPLSEILGPPAAADPVPDRAAEPAVGPPVEPPVPAPPPKGPFARLWGYVRRHEDLRTPTDTTELMPQDIAIWYDRKRNRFEIVADHKVIDDLAPVEFVQFVRALRFSATQILYKFENRADGTAGRPVCVWEPMMRPGAA